VKVARAASWDWLAEMLGLKKNLNVLVDYNPLWEAAFIEESQRLGQALCNVAKGIEH
jgi:GrpB-like predicted nucleotidyltransferase (UPF0157 family)